MTVSKRWRDYKSQVPPGPLRTLLETSNPEIALSALGLFPQAVDDHTMKFLYASTGDAVTKEQQESLLREWETKVKNPDVAKAGLALRALLDCLWHYFGWRTYQETENRTAREPLRRVLSGLTAGDVVITFNWDATVEWTLAEEGRWNPKDGYGLNFNLEFWTHDDRPELVIPPSQIKVLKLHGGIGWVVVDPNTGEVCLDTADLLQAMEIHLDGTIVRFKDATHATHLPPNDEYGFIIPSFIKTVPSGRAMQRVWYLASEAFRKANEVEVYGYSLPESDSAARVLLNGLRFRLEANEVSVNVHAKGEAEDRWRALLGSKATIDPGRIG